MNYPYNDNPDFSKMSSDDLYKWTFSKRPESIPYQKGIFELNKRYSDANIKTSLKLEKMTKRLVFLTILIAVLTIVVVFKEFLKCF